MRLYIKQLIFLFIRSARKKTYKNPGWWIQKFTIQWQVQFKAKKKSVVFKVTRPPLIFFRKKSRP